MRRIILIALAAVLVALGGVAAVAADPGNGNGPPATVPGSPGDDCSHGNSNKPCKDDPQPEHGKDCEDHGQARGNEDHCDGDTTSTDTTPTDTTPVDTTPEVTTSTSTTDTVPPPPTVPAVESSGTPPVEQTTAPVSSPNSQPTKPAKKKSAAAKAKAKITVVRVQKKAHGVVVVTTADGRKHVGVMGSG